LYARRAQLAILHRIKEITCNADLSKSAAINQTSLQQETMDAQTVSALVTMARATQTNRQQNEALTR